MEEESNFFKRYRLLISLVIILLFLELGYWFFKKHHPTKTEGRKVEMFKQLYKRKR